MIKDKYFRVCLVVTIVLLLAIFASCSIETKKTTTIGTETDRSFMINNSHVYIYIIDSCEYLGYVNVSNMDILTHKGNCKFCKERNGK
jgi:hypothetical protein